MGVLRIMSRRGDDRVAWDQEKVAVGDPEAVAAIREAERIFAQERARGATAFTVGGNSRCVASPTRGSTHSDTIATG